MAALPIILNILKITGIVLLSILGFVIVLLLLVLFVPVRYKVSFERTGIEGDEPVEARGHASWLLHIVHISMVYPAENNVTFRLFGIPVWRSSDRKKKNKDDEEAVLETESGDNAESEAESSDNTGSEAEIPASQAEEDFLNHEEDVESDGIEDSTSDSGETEFSDSEDDLQDDEAESDEHKTIFGRIGDLIHKIKYTIASLCDKINQIADGAYNKAVSTEEKLENLRRNIHYYYELLTSETFERTYEKCKKRIIKLLKSVMPRKGDIRIEAGFDDPYTTGEVLAISSMLYPVFGRFVHVYGNFDEAIIRGGGYLKGRIFIWVIAKLGVFYLIDKDLKHMIRLFKKEPAKNKKKHKYGRSSNGRDQ